ncbi:sugar ABC transporter substrate-binding protein [Planctomonas sp. JC2975]|uniref:ABC transporter substrate-binding protein n=1 Tax=Planctomonas sp. JC2975 TaxID=2729626 RepID=UPI001473AE22|nr:sugar ABC transporter substrate-binding protein [Planctomonas sp. JC2975]NNC13768.1 sugar ABC transporter substrate-binding protein [Planctomonas sp. JC2975]
MRALRSTAVVAGILAALTLSGCSGAGNNTSEHATINFMAADPQKTYQPVIDGFEKANPNITVKFTYVPFDQYNNVVSQRIGGKDAGVDVYVADTGTVGELATKGYLKDLSSLKPQAEKSSLSAAVKANEYDGKLWALPMWTSQQYLFYNKDLLTKAGIPFPSSDPDKRMTYEDLLADAKKAKAAGATWGMILDQIDRYYQLQPLAESAGGGSGATGKDLLTADVTNAGWTKAMDWYSELFSSGVAPRGDGAQQMVDVFAGGKAAFMISGPWQITTNAQARPPVNFGIAPNPLFEGGKATMATGSWNIGINPASQHQDAATSFIKYVSMNQQGNTKSTQVSGITPTNLKSFNAWIAKEDAIDAPSTSGVGALTLEELKTAAVNRPNSPGFEQLQDVLDRAFSDIRNGQEVDTTLKNAQSELQSDWDQLK